MKNDEWYCQFHRFKIICVCDRNEVNFASKIVSKMSLDEESASIFDVTSHVMGVNCRWQIERLRHFIVNLPSSTVFFMLSVNSNLSSFNCDCHLIRNGETLKMNSHNILVDSSESISIFLSFAIVVDV